VPSHAPIPPSSPTGVLTQSDLTYLGAFYLAGGSSPWYLQGITHRYIGGNLRLYSTMTAGSPTDHLYEYAVPTLKMSAFNTANPTYDFGDLYDGKRDIGRVGGNPPTTYGLYWDEVDQRMYWVFQDGYNTVSLTDACIGYSTLSDVTHLATGVKAFRLPASIRCKIAFALTPIPAAFASAYCGGYRLGVGFGGITSGGPSASLGPALVALDTSEMGSVAHLGYLNNCTRLVEYGGAKTSPTLPYPARRDTDYNDFTGLSVPVTAGVGYFNNTDYLRATGFWVHTSSKDGFITFVSQSCNGGMNSPQESTMSVCTTTSGTLNVPIPDLKVNDLVAFYCAGYTQKWLTGRILTISPGGLDLTFDDARGSPVTFTTGGVTYVPDSPGLLKRGQWYCEGTLFSTRGKHTAYIYDAATLAAGAMGLQTLDALSQLNWNNSWDHQFGMLTYPATGFYGRPEPPNSNYGGEAQHEMKGMAFDPATNRLYILVKAIGSNPPYVAVYQVP
jgi:hypothetical protein